MAGVAVRLPASFHVDIHSYLVLGQRWRLGYLHARPPVESGGGDGDLRATIRCVLLWDAPPRHTVRRYIDGRVCRNWRSRISRWPLAVPWVPYCQPVEVGGSRTTCPNSRPRAETGAARNMGEEKITATMLCSLKAQSHLRCRIRRSVRRSRVESIGSFPAGCRARKRACRGLDDR